MSKNLPPNGNTDQVSFGPANVYLGPVGATPGTCVGFIAIEDGVNIEVSADRGEIRQGSPSLPIFHYDKSQDIKVTFTGIEWDIDTLSQVLGVGSTVAAGSGSGLLIGGDPTPTGYALLIDHRVPHLSPAQTLQVILWDAVGDGNLALAFTEDHHKIPFTFMARRPSSGKNWAAANLADGGELGMIRRLIL